MPERVAPDPGAFLQKLVAVETLLPGGYCRDCVQGRYRLCRGTGGMSAYGYKPISVAPSLWGGYAQYLLIHERWLLKDDTGLPAEELAAVPLVLVTAMHAVGTLGQVGPGSRVLVHAGASGSGSMAIQVAKALGASVITTVSTLQKAELAQRLGADEVVYYRQRNFADAAREWSGGDGVDVVIDNLGGSAMHDNLRAARWGAKIVNFGLMAGLETTLPNIYQFFRGQYQLLGAFMGTLDELAQGLQLVKAGKVKPVLAEALPLNKVHEAHARIDAHQVAGNLVLLPWA